MQSLNQALEAFSKRGRSTAENKPEAKEQPPKEKKKMEGPRFGRAVVDHDIGAFPDSVAPGPGVGR